MRTKFYFLVFIMLCLGGNAFAGNIVDIAVGDGPGEGGPTINPPAAARMAVMSTVSPISVKMVDDKSLVVSFTANLGVVTVAVKDETGAVYYTKVVNTSNSSKLSVNISGLPAGKYTITFVNTATSLKKYGTFEID
ncbi:MAG: DUF3244 domain-containing protein [Prevotella sp.]|jgi:uncharacterized membrane protein|uniref:DUF3244 domain-containing protein n=1 Tax=unclassified Dysgonomonas TaxID=2630389 RepID=UPI0025C31AAF|nr:MULTISPECIES: DUF3244 domain-containing protein [unclassified Dysgonomonas]MDR1718479.1 DUF3244 domain-containing protein [Prevotella sp.]MDR2002548.1 DUF3244 domain-containing protein [Prevotella sp.]HMM01937.1 DUF3244 domain-containing protein [Dysgonomonas sp.]